MSRLPRWEKNDTGYRNTGWRGDRIGSKSLESRNNRRRNTGTIFVHEIDYTGDLLKAELREGTKYCSNGASTFMESLLEEYRSGYPEMSLNVSYYSGMSAASAISLLSLEEDKDADENMLSNDLGDDTILPLSEIGLKDYELATASNATPADAEDGRSLTPPVCPVTGLTFIQDQAASARSFFS